MARPERFELPTARFVGTEAKSGFLNNQQVRWPALNLFAAKRRLEPRSAAQTLRFLARMTDVCLVARTSETLLFNCVIDGEAYDAKCFLAPACGSSD